jgi:hypothetical protein
MVCHLHRSFVHSWHVPELFREEESAAETRDDGYPSYTRLGSELNRVKPFAPSRRLSAVQF